MFEIDTWQEIFYTIRRNKLRTFLTAFSVAWGIFMLIILLGVGTGLRRGVYNMFSNSASNSILISPGQTSLSYGGLKPGRNVRLNNDDLLAISREVKGIDNLSTRFSWRGEYRVRYKNQFADFQVIGVNPEYRFVDLQTIIAGRYINDFDISEKRKVAVVGISVAETLFSGEIPVGKNIEIRGMQFTIVGMYEDPSGDDQQRRIYIPVSTAQLSQGNNRTVHAIMFTTESKKLQGSKNLAREVKDIIAERHIFDPDDPRAVRISNFAEQFKKFKDLFDGIEVFLWLVGVGTIIAGIVGVSNIMLIVVKERTREIGVRKALGATPGSIIQLFLQEAIFITFIAGYIGLISGIAIIEGLSWYLKAFEIEIGYFRDPDVSLRTAIGATLLLVAAGALAGYFPAKKAVSIQPIEALKDE